MSGRRFLAAAVLVAAAVTTGLAGLAEAAPTTASGRWGGQAAVNRLGARLPAVAQQHGMTTAQLRTELLGDRSLFVDTNDRLLFVDPPQPATTGTDAVYDPAIPEGDVFALHSKPGASRVVYLDFDGHTISGTAWNTSTGGACYAEPFDADGVPGTFSTAERGIVASVWKRVAEDYAPFDVDVTTEDPGFAAINRASTSDLQFGTRALITNSVSPCPNGKTLYNSVCAGGCGGVAYVGVYDNTGTNHDYYQPALVFQNGVSTNAKYVAEATSHEVGHNIGLSHDGTTTVGYYEGHGDWAPIMGVGYYEAISQWSKGEYSGANQKQDDFVVAGTNGLPLRTDDHGNTAAAATALAGSSLAADGIISAAGDVDAFRFDAGAGAATISVTPAPTSPNLDIRLELRNSSGTVLASNDPLSSSTGYDSPLGLGASLSVTLPSAGTYTLLIDGVGKGDPLTNGYTDYGSLGHYRLSGSVPQAVAGQPVAVASATPTSGEAALTVSFDGSQSSDPDGGALSYSWTFGDGVGTSTLASPSYTYSSAGTYTAVLTVTDAQSLSHTASVTITVTAPVIRIDVAGITVSAVRTKSGVVATARVTVNNAAGAAVNGAAVTTAWTAGTKAAGSRTGSTVQGIATITSPTLKISRGVTVRVCVSGLSLTGGVWNQALLAPTTATDCASIPAP